MELKGKIARVLCENDYKGMRVGKRFAWDNCFSDERGKYLNQAEAILPIIEEEIEEAIKLKLEELDPYLA